MSEVTGGYPSGPLTEASDYDSEEDTSGEFDYASFYERHRRAVIATGCAAAVFAGLVLKSNTLDSGEIVVNSNDGNLGVASVDNRTSDSIVELTGEGIEVGGPIKSGGYTLKYNKDLFNFSFGAPVPNLSDKGVLMLGGVNVTNWYRAGEAPKS